MQDLHRAAYHFQPEGNWMNDPNGPVWLKNGLHLFYQYNPFGAAWGNMTWGHALSPDLLHWKRLSPARAPISPTTRTACSPAAAWSRTDCPTSCTPASTPSRPSAWPLATRWARRLKNTPQPHPPRAPRGGHGGLSRSLCLEGGGRLPHGRGRAATRARAASCSPTRATTSSPGATWASSAAGTIPRTTSGSVPTSCSSPTARPSCSSPSSAPAGSTPWKAATPATA